MGSYASKQVQRARPAPPHHGIDLGLSPPSRSRSQRHFYNHATRDPADTTSNPVPSEPRLPHTAQDTTGASPAMAQSTAHRRLLQEYRALTNNPPEGITAGPISEDDLLHWECLIQGPEGTPFEGGVFPAELKFPKDYPLAPPSMKFLADVWHPNGMPAVLPFFLFLQ